MISRRKFFPILPFLPRAAACSVEESNLLDEGFTELYHLRFAEGRRRFEEFSRQKEGNAMGPASVAASFLFEEFEAHAVLTSEFFLDNDRLLGGIKERPNETRMRQFRATADKGRLMAEEMLQRQPAEPDALLAATMVFGMRANSAVLIEKEQLEALRLTREGEAWGRRLLQAAPDRKDGYMALGASSYIIACLPFYKRAIVRLGGIKGDRSVGMQQMAEAARNGRYLRPYAKILLALACLREQQPARARLLLAELVAEFPASPLFRREYDKFALKLK